MKEATVADLRNEFASISAWIEAGEAVKITKRGHLFAILSPVRKKKEIPPWPDLNARLKKAYPNGPVKGASMEEIVDYMRGGY